MSNGGAYTKHIYAANQRIASKLGNEDGFGADPRRVEQAGGKKISDIQKDNIGARYKELGFTYSAPEKEKVEKDSTMDSESEEKLIFFYHPDLLGSTSYVTDLDGNIALPLVFAALASPEFLTAAAAIAAYYWWYFSNEIKSTDEYYHEQRKSSSNDSYKGSKSSTNKSVSTTSTSNSSNNKKDDDTYKSNSSSKKQTSQNQMQDQVNRGKAPKEVDRVDKPHIEGQQEHVNFKDKTSINKDGTVHDKMKGTPILAIKSKIGY